MEMIKDTLLASAAGGGALLLTSYGIQMATDKFAFLKRDDANMQKVQNGGIQIVVGMLAGSAMYKYSREASMGIIAGLGAVGVANILNGLVFKDKPVSLGALPEEMELSSLSAGDSSLLSQYDDSMGALAALEATGVSTAPGAFQGLADPTVTSESLMGTMVQQETLGSYAPYLA
jgi:hypothetical protein